jgi:hypothetical protein
MNNELKLQIIESIANTEKTLQEIADELNTSYKVVWELVSQEFTPEERMARKILSYHRSKLGKLNPMFNKKRELHPNYKGLVSDGKGYILEVKPVWFTGRRGCKHVFKHNLVVCEALGLTELPKGFCIHHIDGIKTNNDLSNLALMTMGAHMKLHSILKRATTIPTGSRVEISEAQDNH